MEILRARLTKQRAAAAGLDWLETEAFAGGTRLHQSSNPQRSFSQFSAAPPNRNPSRVLVIEIDDDNFWAS